MISRIWIYFRGWVTFTALVFAITLVLAKFPDPQHLPGSLVLSAILGLLAFWPIIVYTPTGDVRELEVLLLDIEDEADVHTPRFAIQQLSRQFAYPTLLLAWAASVLLPLDQETKWQVWPFPCLVGGVMGFCVGIALMAIRRMCWKSVPHLDGSLDMAAVGLRHKPESAEH